MSLETHGHVGGGPLGRDRRGSRTSRMAGVAGAEERRAVGR